ncbi:MAG TPA: hypothetical protein VHO01_05440 [Jatrophihabitans sp.]|nr:hypothetical protein [Jatrophihabitans sp.]
MIAAGALRRVRASCTTDDGNAMIEFVFVALLIMVPLVYLVVTVAVVQRARLAATNAARDVGRAIATSTSPADAPARANAALRISLANAGLSPQDVQLRYVASDADCRTGADVVPTLTPGAEFAVCIIRHQRLPGVPSVLSGSAVTTIGRYVVHVDDFRNRQ